MPGFELVWVSCVSDESGREHCSFQAQGKDIRLTWRTEPTLSCPSNLEIAINTTLSVIRRSDNACCELLDMLKPEDARSFLSVCDGNLVSVCIF